MNGWTPERREKQAQAIHAWRPWQRSTGPRTAEGKARSSRNAYRGGERTQSRAIARELRQLFAALEAHGVRDGSGT